MRMFVREFVDEGIWMEQNSEIAGQSSKVEILFSREGQILRIIADGQEQQVEEPGETEIIENRRNHQVPAGLSRQSTSKSAT